MVYLFDCPRFFHLVGVAWLGSTQRQNGEYPRHKKVASYQEVKCLLFWTFSLVGGESSLHLDLVVYVCVRERVVRVVVPLKEKYLWAEKMTRKRNPSGVYFAHREAPT